MSDIKYNDYEFGPGKLVEKQVTLEELKEDFRPGEMVYSLVEEIERLQDELEAADDLHRRDEETCERLRAALERIIASEDSTQNQAYFDLIEIAREALRDE